MLFSLLALFRFAVNKSVIRKKVLLRALKIITASWTRKLAWPLSSAPSVLNRERKFSRAWASDCVLHEPRPATLNWTLTWKIEVTKAPEKVFNLPLRAVKKFTVCLGPHFVPLPSIRPLKCHGKFIVSALASALPSSQSISFASSRSFRIFSSDLVKNWCFPLEVFLCTFS
jgi:hypothetical protein